MAVITVLLMAPFLINCASVRYDRMSYDELAEIDKDTGDKKKERDNFGIPFYEGRPYLLVVNSTDAKGKATRTVSVVSLPDLSKPHRAYIQRGFGKAELTVNLSNGVLTSTTAKGEEPLAALITSAAGAAVVPATITNTRAQAELAKAQAAQAGGLVQFDAARILQACLNDPTHNIVTGPWVRQLESVINRINAAQIVDVKRRKKLIDKMEKWNREVCISDALNFTALPNALAIMQVNEFQLALRPFNSQLKNFVTELGKIKSGEGCEDTTPGDCQILRAALAGISILTKELEAYLPMQEKVIPPFELFKIVYDNKGILTGLKRVHPQ